METFTIEQNAKLNQIFVKFAEDINNVVGGEPLDGDETEKIVEGLLEVLNDFNGNA